MSDSKPQRAERFDLAGALAGDVMVVQHTEIGQISRGGMQVDTPVPLQVDSLHQFRLMLGEQAVVISGRVAHSRIADVDQERVTYRSGVQFVEPSPAALAAIDAFIETLKRARQAR